MGPWKTTCTLLSQYCDVALWFVAVFQDPLQAVNDEKET